MQWQCRGPIGDHMLARFVAVCSSVGGCILARLVAVSWLVGWPYVSSWWLCPGPFGGCLGPFGGRMLVRGGCILARLVAVC